VHAPRFTFEMTHAMRRAARTRISLQPPRRSPRWWGRHAPPPPFGRSEPVALELERFVMRFLAFIAFIGCVCVATEAQAGHPAAPSVSIVVSGSNFTASGSLGAAHNSSNQQEEVGCAVRSYFGAMEVDCSFTKANGVRARCRASADVMSSGAAIERMAKAANTISGSSFVEVTAAGDKCTSIKVTNSSQYVAKSAAIKVVTNSAFIPKSEVQALWDGSNQWFEVSGALSKVRRSSDDVQRIGCSFTAYEGSDPSASCYANDSNWSYSWCNTDIPNQILALRGLKSDSSLWYYFSLDGSIDCDSRVEVVNSSSLDASH
jgi:hypothetical protein